ncbi:MAG TPA: DNA polymerase IV [Chryseosolibacter sp.]
MKKIIHIDMDAFYASIEQRDNPEYRGKPVAVGGSPEGRGGVVATASYEARKFGVKSAMPARKALRLCPDIIFVRPRFDVYKVVSQRIREIFSRYTDLIEPLSLDEAYLDVTTDKLNIGSAIEIAAQIRKAIREELNLTASAGVSVNKFVAKIASDLNKPDGLTFIGPSRIEKFMEGLPVEKFFGVGKVTAARMKSMGLHTGADLKRMSEADLKKHFGKSGSFYYRIVRGIDEREVQAHRETKSIGAEDTFPFDLTAVEDMHDELLKISKTVSERMLRNGLKGRTVTLKIRYHDFKLATRSRSFSDGIDDRETMYRIACELLESAGAPGRKVRLLGVSLSNFGTLEHHPAAAGDRSDQLQLF